MQQNQIRLIAGKWRGRKISFPDHPTLRPTGNRIRETVFNWLQSEIQGAFCLDLFAGSGAFSFEALSRGAEWVVALEKDRKVVECLKENAEHLQAKNLIIQPYDSLQWLKDPNSQNNWVKDLNSQNNFFAQNTDIKKQSFDIVFLDPPFAQHLLPQCFALLEEGNWLKPKAWIYFETNEWIDQNLPEHWHLKHQKKAGAVYYGLIVRDIESKNIGEP